MNFDRFDICEAHYAIEVDYNRNGWLHERPSNVRRREATHVQLHRMHFKSPHVEARGFEGLTDNGKEIYRNLEERYGFVAKSGDIDGAEAPQRGPGEPFITPGSPSCPEESGQEFARTK